VWPGAHPNHLQLGSHAEIKYRGAAYTPTEINHPQGTVYRHSYGGITKIYPCGEQKIVSNKQIKMRERYIYSTAAVIPCLHEIKIMYHIQYTDMITIRQPGIISTSIFFGILVQ
jgi:hypothetical protein